MLGWLTSGLGKWLSGGLIAVVIAGSLYLWHRSEFVARAELTQWKTYARDLVKASEKREQILRKYTEEKQRDDQTIQRMGKELEDALEYLIETDNRCFSDDDVDRLRNLGK